MLPVAVVSQLFPGRFRGLALEIAPSGQMQPRPCDLMALTARPSFIQRLLYPQFIATFLHRIHEELLICMRGVYLSLLFLPAAILAPFAAYSGGPTRAAWLSLMVWTLQRAGPAFIKVRRGAVTPFMYEARTTPFSHTRESLAHTERVHQLACVYRHA